MPYPPNMAPAASRYDVVLSDGSCSTWRQAPAPLEAAVLDFIEYRIPDDFGDPGPLVGGVFRRGLTRGGRPVVKVRRNGYQIDGRGPLHTVIAHERRYLRWDWPDADPGTDFDPPFELPP